MAEEGTAGGLSASQGRCSMFFYFYLIRNLVFEVHEVGRQGQATIDLPNAGLFSKFYVSEETVVVDVDRGDSQQALSQKSDGPSLFRAVVSIFSFKEQNTMFRNVQRKLVSSKQYIAMTK